MNVPIIMLSPEAEHDIDQAVKYYDSISFGLGTEFIKIIDKYFLQILQFPTASAIQYDQVRVKPVKVFPVHCTLYYYRSTNYNSQGF